MFGRSGLVYTRRKYGEISSGYRAVPMVREDMSNVMEHALPAGSKARTIVGAILPTAITLLLVLGAPAPAEAQDAGTSATPALGSSPTDEEYTIGANDVIALQVAGREELSGLVTVDPVGKIQAPMLGATTILGMTPAELTEEFTERYQLLDQSITEVLVSVAKYNSRTLSFIGSVNKPGTIGFRELPDIWDALLAAGGALPEAELGRVQIVRGQVRVDEPRTFRVNLSRGIDGTPASELPELRAGDTIIVPALEAASARPDGFRIFGSVESPGSYSLTQAQSLLDALALAGGGSEDANMGTVRLTRRTTTGVMTYDIDVEAHLMRANPPISFPLHEGDSIHVPSKESFVARFATAIAPFISIASLVVIIQRSN